MDVRPTDRPENEDAPHDPGARQLRASVVRVGLWASVFVSTACAVYLAATPTGPSRPALWAVLGASVLVTAGMVLLQRRRLVPSHRGAQVLHAWAGSQTAIIAVGMALDGGVTSPYVALLFVPLVAGSIGFPSRHAIRHGAWTLVCFTLAASTVPGFPAAAAALWAATIIAIVGIAAATSRSLLELSQDLDRANQRLTHLARVDALTGCLNHRVFHERLQEELARRSRGGAPISLVMLDIDHFKQVNDEHGHPVGDEVLRAIGTALRAAVRPYDVVGRTGGEEFGVLLPNTTGAVAASVAERIRHAVAAAEAPVGVTVSAGLAEVPVRGWTASELLRTADAALYEAKRTGRDRLVAAGVPDPVA
jgi:diguanylate cyclase (GGDEF)-like protein